MAKRKPAKKGAGSGKKMSLKMAKADLIFKIPDLSKGTITYGPNIQVECEEDGTIRITCVGK